MTKSVLGDLPEGVLAVMYLRDGWPDAVVCKVQMYSGQVGIGIYRHPTGAPPLDPASYDQMAMFDAMQHIGISVPDYTPLHEHAAKMARAASPATAYEEEPDQDLQAQLGQKAHD